MTFRYSNTYHSTLASIAGGTGITSFTVTSASGFPTLASGDFTVMRVADETANTEDIICTAISGTTVTCNATTIAHSNGDTIDGAILSTNSLDQLKNDALSGGPHGSTITGAGALTLGIMNYVNLTSAGATLTIADGTYDGQAIGIQMLDTCTKLATLDPASSTKIDGSLTRIMWAGEVAWLSWDKANTMWRKVAGKSIPMIGSMYLASNTGSTVDSVQTQVLLDTSDVDNTGLMVNTGSHKVTLQRPGNYVLSIAVAMGFASIATNAQAVGLQGATVIAKAIASWASTGTATPAVTLPFIGAAADDMTLAYFQNSGGTSPIIVGGRGITFLAVSEIPSW